MSLKPLSPQDALRLINEGAVLIDVRSPDEHARESIPQARHIPMDRLQREGVPLAGAGIAIFHCRSGNRTRIHAQALAACITGEGYLLDGGLDAWKKAGLPVVVDKSRPLELQRQVQIAAGSMALLGVVLGAAVSPWFYLVPGFVGAGLIFAGLSGHCGLARLLVHMPWNRHIPAP